MGKLIHIEFRRRFTVIQSTINNCTVKPYPNFLLIDILVNIRNTTLAYHINGQRRFSYTIETNLSLSIQYLIIPSIINTTVLIFPKKEKNTVLFSTRSGKNHISIKERRYRVSIIYFILVFFHLVKKASLLKFSFFVILSFFGT